MRTRVCSYVCSLPMWANRLDRFVFSGLDNSFSQSRLTSALRTLTPLMWRGPRVVEGHGLLDESKDLHKNQPMGKVSCLQYGRENDLEQAWMRTAHRHRPPSAHRHRPPSAHRHHPRRHHALPQTTLTFLIFMKMLLSYTSLSLNLCQTASGCFRQVQQSHFPAGGKRQLGSARTCFQPDGGVCRGEICQLNNRKWSLNARQWQHGNYYLFMPMWQHYQDKIHLE